MNPTINHESDGYAVSMAMTSSTLSSSSLSLVASARSAETPASISLFSSNISEYSSISQALASSSSLEKKEDPKPDYLEYLYPIPQRPPRYSTVKASRAISFPIYERPETCILPSYTPAVYELTLVLRKVEWVSPYEASTVRGWKNLIMEINSTQLNFYSIEGIPILSKVKKSKTKKHYEFTPVEQDFILETIKRNPQKYLSQSKLVKSYSLQHAKFGLPIDYKKRQSCLRLRCETEQFIVQYIDLDNLIQWANALSIGINVSLDLDSREMPTDRIVPRRRRNRRNRHRAFSDSELIRRELAEPRHPRRASFSGESNGLKSKISRIFGKKRSNTIDIEQLTRDFGELEFQKEITITDPVDSTKTTAAQISPRHRRNVSTTSTFTTIREEDGEGDEDDEDEEGEDIPDNEIHSIRELHDSDDEESIHDGFHGYSMSKGIDHFSLDEKWNPDPKKYSRRKFLKDSLRCIKLLSNEDSWVGKKVVKSTPTASKGKINRVVWEECMVGLQGFVPSHVITQRITDAF